MSLTRSAGTATGGNTVQDIDGYRIHTFTTVGTSTFTPIRSGPVEVLVVAGGGGSGGGQGGAGGGGGVIYNSNFTVSGAVTVTVGNGGAGGIDINTAGSNGGNSIFSSLTAIGGGGGGADVGSLNGKNGGSGGGGGSDAGTFGTAGTGTVGQGQNGGTASESAPGYGGGGGGGAGAVGGNGAGSNGGNGGNGLSYSISGRSVYYGGGGGGGIYQGNGTPGTGGLGGGGNGASTGSGQNGTANKGGGGGGGGTKVNGVLSNGGSGIVIVRYPISMILTRAGTATGGNTVQDIGGYLIHTFTTTGTQSFTVTVNQITGAKILVVAGGGGGGQSTGGGGGAGGLIYTSSTTLSSGTYSITVGGGGAGSSAAGNNSGIGFKGGSSIISGPGIATQTAIGGGGGGHNNALSGSGGSGGGAVNSPGGAGTAGQGNPGGSDSGASYTGAGGGGAGQAGQNAAGNGGTINGGGNGGNGLAYDISGTSTYYAGGGGGGSIAPRPVGSGGLGGGGSAVFGGGTGGNGTANTGGGGAGGTYLEGTFFAGGNGGSGIVIVAYPIPTGTSSTMTGTPLFSQLSASATSSAVGAFSLRAVNGTTVKAVQIKRQSDNATQDFYADRLGNLLTAPVTGTSLANWLGGAGANVVTWYDQSGRGNHATQGTAENQPTINLSNVSISFNGSQFFSNATPTGMFIPLYQNTYSVVTKHQQWSAGGAWGTGNTASFANGSFNGLRWSTGSNYQNFIGGGFLTFGPQPGTYPVVATVVNNRTNVIGYINGTQSASSTQNPTIEPIYSQFIGQAPNGGVMQGELRAVLFFQSAISTVDRTIVESLI